MLFIDNEVIDTVVESCDFCYKLSSICDIILNCNVPYNKSYEQQAILTNFPYINS